MDALNLNKILVDSFRTALIDSGVSSDEKYRPRLLVNDSRNGIKVLNTICDELLSCDEFAISVAFINDAAVNSLTNVFDVLEKKNVKGRILTTNYLNYTEPKALKRLNRFKNLEIRMFDTGQREGFHTKGYMFKKGQIYDIIVGSSNFTESALTKNQEWNIRLVGKTEGEYASKVIKEFDSLWCSIAAKKYDEFIDIYETIYEDSKKQRKIALEDNIVSLKRYRLEPNLMQAKFINSLQELLKNGEQKALLISATGTGKTYASAFAMRRLKIKKLLFLVHREIIAKSAKESFEMVFNNNIRCGLVSGTIKNKDCDFIFATKDTFTNDNVFKKFDKNYFDAIIIDEVHRLGERTTYKKILDYFKPKKILLGMTATPERTDQYDIYSDFDHNIACEIRLKDAMAEDLLCPFHYFGITEFLTLNNYKITKLNKSKSGELSYYSFKYLVLNKRVNYILEKIDFYGYSGDRVKGLVFCSTIAEANELSRIFNKKGRRSEVLTGDNSESVREEYIDRLVSDTREDYLEYLFTVNIFNEGVDIPEINQIVLLRPTKSSIIFVQQIGRGLRKTSNKEFVVILDFIGNYDNNYMIPIALSGDRTYSKDRMRKFLITDKKMIPGSSVISFDKISEEKIFNSINKIKRIPSLICNSYKTLMHKLGRTPWLIDFYDSEEVDPLLIVRNYKSHYNLQVKVEKNKLRFKFNNYKKTVLEYLSMLLIKGIRPHEFLVLEKVINNESISYSSVNKSLVSKFKIRITNDSYTTTINNINGKFVRDNKELNKFKSVSILKRNKNQKYEMTDNFKKALGDKNFYLHIRDLLETGIARYNKHYKTKSRIYNCFVLYEKYSRRDVCLMMDIGKDISSTMYGKYRFNEDLFLFVTYHKVEKNDKALEYAKGKPNYSDEFVDNLIFNWDSQIGKGVNSGYVRDVLQTKNKHLFIKKNDDEDSFYYVGKFNVVDYKPGKKKNNNNIAKDITKFVLRLDTMISDDLLKYFKSYIPD